MSIVLGLFAGFIASQIVNRGGLGVWFDAALGVTGALVGGLLLNAFGSVGVTGLNVWRLFVAVAGAIIVLVAYHAILGRRSLRT